MCPVRFFSRVVLCAWLVAALHVDAFAQASALPSPLTIGDVARLASDRRDEITAARARRRAADERPAIVGALDDPMLSPSLDHAPFMGGGADFSFTIEQQFPLSKIRQHRRDAANADILRRRAEVTRAHLDVRAEAINAFLMLHERRRMQALIDEQLSFARDVVVAANACRFRSPQTRNSRYAVSLSRPCSPECLGQRFPCRPQRTSPLCKFARRHDGAAPIRPLGSRTHSCSGALLALSLFGSSATAH